MLSPKIIKDYLDKYVAGQEEAKVAVSNTLFMHAVRTNYLQDNPNALDEGNIKVNNLLVTGPSGCGKTFIIEKAAECIGLPVVKVNAKSLSNTGYVGITLDETLQKAKKKHRSPLFEYAIVIIDEFDKICTGINKSSPSEDSQGNWLSSIQYSLLKTVEGTEAVADRYAEPLNTANMMFIFAGNFEGLRVLRKEEKNKQTIGFSRTETEKEFHGKSLPEQLITYGVVRELVGRISTVVEITKLTKEELKEIIQTKEGTVLDQYNALFQYAGSKGLDLKNDKVADKIAEECIKLKIGARGLGSVIDKLLKDKIFNLKLDRKPDEYDDGIQVPKLKRLTNKKIPPKVSITIKDKKDDE